MRDVCYRLITRYDNRKPCTIEVSEAHGFRGANDPRGLEEIAKKIHAYLLENFPSDSRAEIVTSFFIIDRGIEYATKIVMRDEHA